MKAAFIAMAIVLAVDLLLASCTRRQCRETVADLQSPCVHECYVAWTSSPGYGTDKRNQCVLSCPGSRMECK